MDHTVEIELFWFGSALLCGLDAMKARKWRAYVLWGLTGFFLLGGVFWIFIRDLSQRFTAFVTAIATNPLAWFILVVLAILWVATTGRQAIPQRDRKREAAEKGDGVFGFAESIQNAEPIEKQISDLRAEVRGLKNGSEKLRQELSQQIASLLEAQENRFKGEISGAWIEINQLRDAVSELTGSIADIDVRTKFPPNLGRTLGDALQSAETVRLGQIGNIRDTVNDAIKQLGNTHLELVHLLDFALNQLSEKIFARLMSEHPNFDKMKPPTSPDSVEGLMMDISVWIRDLMSRVQDCSYGEFVANQFFVTQRQAEDEADRVPPNERPDKIDPLLFRRYYVKVRHSELMLEAVEQASREVRGAQIPIINSIRRFYNARETPRAIGAVPELQ